MTNAQKEVLIGYLQEPSTEIDQIHFLSGGNISKEELTVVSVAGGYRYTDLIDGEGRVVSTSNVQVKVAQ